jgi:hypothetical protein
MANSTRVLEFVFLHFKVNEKLMIKVSLLLDQRLSRIKKKLQLVKVGISEVPIIADVCKIQILWNLALICQF